MAAGVVEGQGVPHLKGPRVSGQAARGANGGVRGVEATL
jgi:hypothetical protein